LWIFHNYLKLVINTVIELSEIILLLRIAHILSCYLSDEISRAEPQEIPHSCQGSPVLRGSADYDDTTHRGSRIRRRHFKIISFTLDIVLDLSENTKFSGYYL
jgi:hypothetical protein